MYLKRWAFSIGSSPMLFRCACANGAMQTGSFSVSRTRHPAAAFISRCAVRLLTSLQQEVLAGGGEIRFGMPVAGADVSGILKFADGSSAKADLVIGADGH